MSVKEKIEKLLEALNKGVYERELELKLALLSSIAGESIFLLGPPGVAKSLVARKLKYAYKDATVFEYLMSRFSTPDEIFGPVSIKKLKEEDKYERVVTKYLPTSDVVFLDEIWKAGPSIQNALLTVINEKKFRNGDEEIDVPMKALISASNELPAKDQGLEALWDRFLVRLIVQGIEDKDNFNKMISEKLDAYKDSVNEDDKITEEEYKGWNEKIDEIKVPENVFNVINYIRNYIDEHNKKDGNSENQIYVSDRRWRKIVRLLKASAFLNDRIEVDLMDCFLIRHCIWNEEEQTGIVYGFVKEAIEKYGYTVSLDFKGIKEELKEFQNEIDEETRFVKDTRTQVLKPIHVDYYEILNPPSDREKFIKQIDFNNLSNQNQSISLYYWNSSYRRVEKYNDYYNSKQVRKGNSKFTIFINDKEYSLQQTTQGEKRQQTRKPNEYTEKAWDGRVSVYLENTENMKTQIEKYSSENLKHLRTNIFVSPELANIVESHITDTLNTIEKIKVEIKEIQNNYKKLKDEEIIS
jgi:MoxR-like ATPase